MKTQKYILCLICLSFSLMSSAQKFEKLDKSPMDRAYYPSNGLQQNL